MNAICAFPFWVSIKIIQKIPDSIISHIHTYILYWVHGSFYLQSTTLQDHMPHVEQQSHGCTTLASKHANHLTTSKVRAPLLRVHTTLYDACTNDRETQCDRKRHTRSPLNFKHVQKSDATPGERKIACSGSDCSCNVGEPSCECQKAGSQSVLKWSCANCERGFTDDTG